MRKSVRKPVHKTKRKIIKRWSKKMSKIITYKGKLAIGQQKNCV